MKKTLTRETLRSIRHKKGVTQAEFAKKIGYSEVYIRKLENGDLPITSEFTKNFLNAFDLETAYRRAYSNDNEVKNENPAFYLACVVLLVLIFVLIF